MQLYREWRTWTHTHTHTHAYTHRSVFKYSDIRCELFAVIIWENIVNKKTKIVPSVWISGSIACVYCSIGHVLQSTAWKLGEAKVVGEAGYLFMCMFVSHLSQTPSYNVCTILYVVSYQAVVAMMKLMCGEGLFCVGWVVGPGTIKPCDLAGQMLILCVRLMPHNWRNLHYFHCSFCTHPLTNVVFSPSGKSLPFLLFLSI